MSEEVTEYGEKGESSLSKIEKKLVEADPKIFDGIKEQKKQQLIRGFVVTMHKTHIGPLPDPETLSEYSSIIPNGAERIMKMADKQLEHRMFMEKKVIGGQLTQSNIGQFLAFFYWVGSLGFFNLLYY